MVDRTRKMKEQRLPESLDFSGGLSDVIQRLQNLHDKHPDAYIKADYHYCDAEETSYVHSLHIDRPETDKEMQDRIAEEESYEKRWNDREREQYEFLKKKFETLPAPSSSGSAPIV